MMSRFLFIIFYLFFSQLNAIEFKGKFIQGHFILGKTNPNTKIFILGSVLPIIKCPWINFPLNSIAID